MENKNRFPTLCKRTHPSHFVALESPTDYLCFLLDKRYSFRFRVANTILRDRLRWFLILYKQYACPYMDIVHFHDGNTNYVWLRSGGQTSNYHNSIMARELYDQSLKLFGADESAICDESRQYGDGFDTPYKYGSLRSNPLA